MSGLAEGLAGGGGTGSASFYPPDQVQVLGSSQEKLLSAWRRTFSCLDIVSFRSVFGFVTILSSLLLEASALLIVHHIGCRIIKIYTPQQQESGGYYWTMMLQ